MKGEYYKMEYDAWDEGTVDLTLEQEAAYLRLCHQMYRRGGEMANSTKLLCTLFRCQHNKAVALLKALVAVGKIVITDHGTLTNKKVSRVLVDRESMASRRRVDRGSIGGRPRVPPRKPLLNKDVDVDNHSQVRKRREEKREDISSTLVTEAACEAEREGSKGNRDFRVTYSEMERKALAFEFDGIDVDQAIEELERWCDRTGIVKPNERKSAIYGAVRKRHGWLKLASSIDALEPVTVSPQLAASRLARRDRASMDMDAAVMRA